MISGISLNFSFIAFLVGLIEDLHFSPIDLIYYLILLICRLFSLKFIGEVCS